MLLIAATNPTIDRTIEIPELVPHHVHRAVSLRISAGGKGLNVGRACQILGSSYITAGFLGGSSGRLLRRLTDLEGLNTAWIEFDDIETKMSHLLRHRQGDSTVINEPGPVLSSGHWQAICSFIIQQSLKCQAAVLAGSVPPGVSAQSYLQLCLQIQKQAGPTLIDTPGATLKAVINAPQGLAVKVNRDELGEALGQTINQIEEAAQAARTVLKRGASMVCVTMGASGAVAVNHKGAWYCSYSVDNLVSSVGSGDSFSAGLCLYGQNMELPEALQWASACGAANAETELPAVFTLERVKTLIPLIKVYRL
ncbi:MAG: 1-phosphofructokinase family hexose kinase [Candidatus Bruticola sp.]